MQVYSDSAPSLKNVSRWIRAFAAGRVVLEDKQRHGRPRSSLTRTTTVRARSIIADDQTVTLRF